MGSIKAASPLPLSLQSLLLHARSLLRASAASGGAATAATAPAALLLSSPAIRAMRTQDE